MQNTTQNLNTTNQPLNTRTKEFSQVIQNHILDYFEAQDYDEEITTDEQAFISQIDSILTNSRNLYPTPYHVLKHMAQGGSFLIYYHEVVNFYVNKCFFDRVKLEKDLNKTWELYKHNLALHGEKLYNSIKKAV